MNCRLLQLYILGVFFTISFFDLRVLDAALIFAFSVISVVAFSFLTDRHTVSPVIFVSIAYLIGFPLVILFPDLFPDNMQFLHSSIINEAMAWSLRGYLAFVFAYRCFFTAPENTDTNKITASRSYLLHVTHSIGWLSLSAWLISLITFGVGLTFIKSGSELGLGGGTFKQFLHHLIDLKYPFFLLFTLSIIRKYYTKSTILLFSLLLTSDLVGIMAIGSKGAIIRTLVSYFLVFSIIPFRFRIRNIVLVMLSVIAIYGAFSTVTEYRYIMRDNFINGRNVLSVNVQTKAFNRSIAKTFRPRTGAHQRSMTIETEDIIGRFGSGMYSWHNLLRLTSGRSPYENSTETFLLPAYSLLPRVILPGKPTFFHAGQYAEKLLGWTYGGISVSLVGSLYYSWGYAGIILGMAFLGAILGHGFTKCRGTRKISSHWLIITVTLTLLLLDVGVTFHSIMTNIFRIIFILLIIHFAYIPKLLLGMRFRLAGLSRGGRIVAHEKI